MDVDHPISSALNLPSSKVTMLHGHQSEVFTCAWSPQGDTIVSGYVHFNAESQKTSRPLTLSMKHWPTTERDMFRVMCQRYY